jgi:hypothetical protein
MSFKILFNGFRHGHIHGLYQKVTSSAIAEIAGCIEPNDEARAAAESTLGAVFSTRAMGKRFISCLYLFPIALPRFQTTALETTRVF